MQDSTGMAADSVVIAVGTFAGIAANDIVAVIVALGNLIYIIIRLIDRIKRK